jgi:preprotein translocase subunit SecF
MWNFTMKRIAIFPVFWRVIDPTFSNDIQKREMTSIFVRFVVPLVFVCFLFGMLIADEMLKKKFLKLDR